MNIEAIRHNVAEPIRGEYAAVFRTLRETLACIRAEDWLAGDGKITEPVRQVCHLLFALEGSLGGHKVRKGGRFGTGVESFASKVDPEKCPQPADILPWIDEVAEIADRHIERAVRLTLSDRAKQHPPLNRVLYILRHTTVHLSYLVWELRSRGVDCRGC